MSSENAEVRSFFTRYEAANAIFDVEQIVGCYAEVFMFGGPAGVQCVKKDDFLKVLPRRKEFFRSRGLVSSGGGFSRSVAIDFAASHTERTGGEDRRC